MKRVSVRPRADADISELADSFTLRHPDPGIVFLDAVKYQIGRLIEHAGKAWGAGLARAENKDIRVCRIPGFEQHLIFFRPLPDGIEIVRVLWLERHLILKEEDEEE